MGFGRCDRRRFPGVWSSRLAGAGRRISLGVEGGYLFHAMSHEVGLRFPSVDGATVPFPFDEVKPYSRLFPSPLLARIFSTTYSSSSKGTSVVYVR